MALAGAPLLVPRPVRAQSDADPAVASHRQALRVLLGSGDASPISADSFTFDGRVYRGSFQRDDGGAVVNVVDLEQYLYSVVSREMPASWPAAALAAQSICARTYVLARSDPRRDYDLVPSELDQVYNGISGETPGATAAVDATSGQVLAYGPQFASMAYSSCCGGHTESSADAWGNVPIPYLFGVVCPWCTDSPNYRWTRTLALDIVAQSTASLTPVLGRLQDVQVASRDPSGRARAFELVTDQGSATIGGSAFRRAVGSRVLPSLLVTSVTRTPDGTGVAVDGGGLGHGVGLCQWGARGMANAGHTAQDIMGFYFPGTELRNLS